MQNQFMVIFLNLNYETIDNFNETDKSNKKKIKKTLIIFQNGKN